MTRDEIVTALRCCTDIDGEFECSTTCPFFKTSDELGDCCTKKNVAAADLIENQQRHIEALMKANAGLRDTIMRRDKQIEDMKQGMAQLAKAVAVEEVELIEWKEVSREEEPTLYKALEGIPGAEDTTLMRGTLRVLRKERG